MNANLENPKNRYPWIGKFCNDNAPMLHHETYVCFLNEEQGIVLRTQNNVNLFVGEIANFDPDRYAYQENPELPEK